MEGTHSSVGKEGSKIFISQIVGNNEQGGRVFGKTKILELDNPIKIDDSFKVGGRQITREIEKIIATGTKLFVIKTVNSFYYEIGFM